MAQFTSTLDVAWGICQISVQPWRVCMGKASNASKEGIGIMLESPEGIKLE